MPTSAADSSGERFPLTRVSVLTRLREGDEPARQEAFGLLVRAYWRPVYTYLRLRWRLEPTDAEDHTQGFLAVAWQKDFFRDYDPGQARFRTYLRTCLDRYVLNQRKAAGAWKRGGGVRHARLDFKTAEGGLVHREVADPEGTEELFQQEFVRELFTRAVGQLRTEFEGRGRGVVYAVFDRYDLGPAAGTVYADVARDLGISVTQVTNHLHAARRRFREIVLDQIRELTGSEEEFREEVRDILGLELR